MTVAARPLRRHGALNFLILYSVAAAATALGNHEAAWRICLEEPQPAAALLAVVPDLAERLRPRPSVVDRESGARPPCHAAI